MLLVTLFTKSWRCSQGTTDGEGDGDGDSDYTDYYNQYGYDNAYNNYCTWPPSAICLFHGGLGVHCTRRAAD